MYFLIGSGLIFKSFVLIFPHGPSSSDPSLFLTSSLPPSFVHVVTHMLPFTSYSSIFDIEAISPLLHFLCPPPCFSPVPPSTSDPPFTYDAKPVRCRRTRLSDSLLLLTLCSSLPSLHSFVSHPLFLPLGINSFMVASL